MSKSRNSGNRTFTRIFHDELPIDFVKNHPEEFAFYYYLKSNAAYYDYKTTYKGKQLELKKLELVKSYRDLSRDLKMNVHQVTKRLKFLQNKLLINVDTQEGFTRIKILELVRKKHQTPSIPLFSKVAEENPTNSQTVDVEIQTLNNSIVNFPLLGLGSYFTL